MDSKYHYIDELVRKSQGGDKEAFSDILSFYKPLMMAAVKRCILREPSLQKHKEDVESESVLALDMLIKNYDSNLSYFSYYLSTRLDYAILNRCRQFILCGENQESENIYFSDLPHDWEPEHNDDPFGKIRTAKAIQDAISKLTNKQKEAIQLYFFDNMTQYEASKEMGINQASFCKLLQRSLLSLKDILTEDFLN